MKEKTKLPVLTNGMVRTLSECDGKPIDVITLTKFQSRSVRADRRRYNSPQKNHCGKITYPLGVPHYRGYMLRVYIKPPNPKPEQASL